MNLKTPLFFYFRKIEIISNNIRLYGTPFNSPNSDYVMIDPVEYDYIDKIFLLLENDKKYGNLIKEVRDKLIIRVEEI